MSKSLSIAEAKRRFSDVLGAVRHRGDRFVLQRRGTAVAAIVSMEDLATLEGRGQKGALGLVGGFRDAKALPDALDDVVRTRSKQRQRRPPRLGR